MSSPVRPVSAVPSTSANSSSRISRQPLPNISVITSPPWAKDEPPSPTDKTAELQVPHADNPTRSSDVASFQSSAEGLPNFGSRWWAFTASSPRDRPPMDPELGGHNKPEKKGLSLKDRSMSWRIPAAIHKEGASFFQRDTEHGHPSSSSQSPHRGDWNMSIALPTPAVAHNTLAQTKTPGWNDPWTPRDVINRSTFRRNSYGMGSPDPRSPDHHSEAASDKEATPWAKRRKRLRVFIISNSYVPLLFRFINLTLTAAALGVAIRIRRAEINNHVLGAVGSSPMLVIIFTPLTLLHVMFAVYLEYFGRPLGLWRTSAKLAHTLSEVLFICAWSAALSLCFDNFFTSLVPCAPYSRTSWYNQLPRPASPIPDLGRNEGGIGDTICDDQLALICLVGFGLLMYCTNLVISLFRIFEKVKYQVF